MEACSGNFQSTNDLVNSWLLELALTTSWDEYRKLGSVSQSGTRDFLNGIIRRMGETTDVQCHLIALLCQLSDGETPHYEYEEDAECTPLELALQSLETVMEDSQFKSFEAAHQNKFIHQNIMQQAVFVCCRMDDFPLAKVVYERLKKQYSINKKCSKAIQTVLKAEDCTHCILLESPFEELRQLMVESLQLVFEKLPAPTLYTMAAKVLQDAEIDSGNSTDTSLRPKRDIVLGKKGRPALLARMDLDNFEDHPLNEDLVCNQEELDIKVNSLASAKMDISEVPAILRQITGQDAGHRDPANRKRKSRPKTPCPKTANGVIDDVTDDVTAATSRPSTSKKPLNRADKENAAKRKADSGILDESLTSRLGGQRPRSLQNRLSEPRSPETRSPGLRAPETGRRRPWSAEEEEQLYIGVRAEGPRWAKIISKYEFNARTNMNAKDKWRNLLNLPGRMRDLAIQYGSIPGLPF